MNAGASLAVVVAIYVFGVGNLTGYVWFAFLGAAVVSVGVVAEPAEPALWRFDSPGRP